MNLQSTNYPGLSGLSSPNHGFDNNTGSNNQRENQQHQQHQQPSGGLLAAVTGRDANSPAILIPRGFGESGDGNLSFLGDWGNQNLFPGFWVQGILENFGEYFVSDLK